MKHAQKKNEQGEIKPTGSANDKTVGQTETDYTICGATDQNLSIQSHSVCSFVNRRSVSGLQQTTGSLSPLALLSSCCFSNLSPTPKGAAGKFCRTSWLPQQEVKKNQIKKKINICSKGLHMNRGISEHYACLNKQIPDK